MNAAQIHLMLNHVPVIGALFATVILAIGLLWHSVILQRLAFGTLAVIALAAVPVYLSGEPAEEIIENATGVDKDVVNTHEAMAQKAMIAIEVIGLAAVAGLMRFRRREIPRAFATTLLIAMFAVSGVLAWTAHLGGLIRHPELRQGAATIEAQR